MYAQKFSPAPAESIMMGQHAAIRHKSQPLCGLGLTRVIVILTQYHRSRAAAGYDSAILVGLKHGLPASTVCQCLPQVAGKTTQHINQPRLPDCVCYAR